MSQHLHLKRIRLEQFRRFETAIEIPGLAPGLNVLFGPQETGKSTIVSAIRAAFLERCGSSVHDDYLPRGNTGASPSVELDFSFAGADYQLAKTFMHKTRCDLQVGAGQRHNGQAAEDLLAELMGFGFPGKGKNKNADNLGVPGLLWVEQGHTEAAAAIRGDMASKRLAETLQSDAGEMTSTAGNALIDRLTEERAALLTDTGKPRKGSPLYEAQEAVSSLEREVSALEEKATAYRERVDQFAQLLPELEQFERDKPWEEHRKLFMAATDELKAAEDLAGRHKAAADNLELAKRHLRSLQQAKEQLDSQRKELAKLQGEIDDVSQSVGRADELERLAKEQRDEAKAAVDAAHTHLRSQRIIQQCQNFHQEINFTCLKIEEYENTHQTALELREELRECVKQQASLEIDPADVESLQALTDELRLVQATIEGAATRLEFELDAPVDARLDGKIIQGKGDQLLTGSATLMINGVGRLVITPGGEELEQLRDTLEQLKTDHTDLLARMGVADLQAALDRHRDLKAASAKEERLRQRLEDLAPSGIDALADTVQRGRDIVAENKLKLDALVDANPDLKWVGVPVDQDQAEMSLEEASQRFDRMVEAHNQIKTSRQEKSVLLERLQQDRASILKRLDDPDSIREQEVLAADTTQATEQVENRTSELAALAQRIELADIDSLKLKTSRFENAERVARERLKDLVSRKERLETLLHEDDAFGLEERLAELQQQLEAAHRRLGQYELRARALNHLLERLGEHRRLMTERLTAPLAQAMQPFLDILLPGTSPTLSIDESMTPVHLTRSGTRSSTHPVDDLSYGTREQLWMITRLAYGSLLSRRGQPAMVMLDDPLTHSDKDRLELMKQILLKGAAHCQILVFTCQPERWSDSGAPMFDLKAMSEG